jgi:ubiquitin-protein ligase
VHSKGEPNFSQLLQPPAADSCADVQIYHPNVDLEGNVCLNILREDWKPVLNLNSVMVGLQYLFLEPNADDPLNKGVQPCEMYKILCNY